MSDEKQAPKLDKVRRVVIFLHFTCVQERYIR